MKIKGVGMFMAAWIVLAMVCTGCSDRGESKGKLRVGVREDIMNFGFLNEKTGKYYSLEIDLACKLAEELGYQVVEFTTVTPDDRKQMLLDEDIDCLIAAYSITEKRLNSFDFSAAYYEDKSRIMVQKSSQIEDVSDLEGKVIGVLKGADTGMMYAMKLEELGLIPDVDADTVANRIKYAEFETYGDLSVALEEGAVDVACMDGCIAQTFMDDDRMFLEETLADENYGVATQKDSALSGLVSDAISRMLEDGTIDAMKEKWS